MPAASSPQPAAASRRCQHGPPSPATAASAGTPTASLTRLASSSTGTKGTDPASRDNQWLRRCLDLRLPILYFFGIAPARYAVYTCFVVADDPRRLTFLLEPVTQDDRKHSSVLSAAAMVLPPIERAYALRLARQRVHQTRFREAVLDAYAGRCAICHLRHRELLDAAHIIPDGEPDGLAEVPNGLSLCKLHHAAYDSQAIGITPDRVVRIAPAILTERDGPMLEHGFKAFEGAKLVVPAEKLDWPKAERLAARWRRCLGGGRLGYLSVSGGDGQAPLHLLDRPENRSEVRLAHHRWRNHLRLNHPINLRGWTPRKRSRNCRLQARILLGHEVQLDPDPLKRKLFR
ncbi:MAG: HNH endonuclease [bacterium]